MLKNAPKKGKKDKSTKKADRKARKEAERNGTADENGHSPGESGSDNGDDNGDDEQDAASDDELTRKINAEAKELEEPEQEKEVQWSVDMSEEAIKARAKALPEDLKQSLVIDENAEDEGKGKVYEDFGKWIDDQAKEQGSISKVSDVDIYIKAKDLGIESKRGTLEVLAVCLFDDDAVKQIPKRAAMIKKMITSEKHEKAFLGGIERLVGVERPKLMEKISYLLIQIYDSDILDEEVLKTWCSKVSKKYVDIAVAKEIRKNTKIFLTWLEEAEEEDSDSE